MFYCDFCMAYRLLTLGWGDFLYTLERPSPTLQETFDFIQDAGYYIRVTAGLDTTEGVATWTIQTLDPQTGRCWLNEHLTVPLCI